MMEPHQLEFSPDGKLFALLNEHGVLKIWDTETNELKQEYTPNLHLSCPCTCLTWITVQQQKKKSKKERKSIENESSKTFYLAMGTSKGGVALYSYAAAKIERNFSGDGHSGRVTGITFDNSNLLYTIGEDCLVLVWNIFTECSIKSWSIDSTGGGSKEKPYSVKYLTGSENLLIGSKQIHLYSSKSQELIQTFTGHTSDVILLTTFVYNSIEYAITASKMERILCLWTLNKKSKYKNASCTFLMEDIAYCISCKIDSVANNDEDDGEVIVTDGKLKLVAVTRSGRIHAYVIPMASIKTEKPVKPSVTFEITTDNSTIVEPLPIIAASLHFECKDKEILFAYGNDKHFLVFEQIALNLTEKIKVLVRNDPKKMLQSKSTNKQQTQENALKTVTPFVNTDDVEYKSTVLVTKKRQSALQIPMETRLQNLHLTNGEIPQAQSKVQLLIQALHSKDETLLTTVLSTKDTKVIQLTIQKLPVHYIESLINELTLMMQKKRSHVQTAVIWLKILIKTHTSQLMAFGANDLLTKFGPCLGIIEHRTNCLKELSRLSGRLQLLVNQIKRNTEDEENLYNENSLLYEDKDSEVEDDIEDKISSDDEWQEDESGGEPDENMEVDEEDKD